MIVIMIMLLIISILLESLVPNLIRNFIPFFIITTIIIGSTFKIRDKDFYLIIFIVGIIYDLMYTNAVILNGFSFVLIAYLSKYIMKEKVNFFKMFIAYYVLCLSYAFIMVIFTFPYVPYSMYDLGVKLLNSIIINSIYFIMVYLLFISTNCLISNRNKKHSYF